MSTTMLYRAPGPHEIHGAKLDYIVVPDAEIDAALSDGWFLTTPEALAALDAPADNKPPTRSELEQKAQELGIEFGPRISDKKLRERIEERLKTAAA